MPERWRIIEGDCRERLRELPERSVDCCITSPPYWGLRDYGVGGQLGLEQTPDEYLATMVDVFRKVWWLLRDDATLWLNMGDAMQDKQLLGMPWRLAFALQAAGWYLRSDIIWHKPNPMPESCTDRPTKAHEYLFLLTKRPTYYYDGDAIREAHKEPWRSGTAESSNPHSGRLDDPEKQQAAFTVAKRVYNPAGRNKHSVWTIATQAYSEAHFATFPEALVLPCILAGTSDKGCCPGCGAPWRRLVEKDRVPTRPGHNSKVYVDPEGSPYEQHAGSVIGNRDPQRHTTETRTIGWEPGCECNRQDPPIPCAVLDPFAGSGTVGLVCRKTGRDFVGIELNAEYAEMARRRISNPENLKATADVVGQTELSF